MAGGGVMGALGVDQDASGTARATAQALVRAGAASVWVATLARARRVSEYGYTRALQDEDKAEVTTYGTPARLQQESNYSSHDQPSF